DEVAAVVGAVALEVAAGGQGVEVAAGGRAARGLAGQPSQLLHAAGRPPAAVRADRVEELREAGLTARPAGRGTGAHRVASFGPRCQARTSSSAAAWMRAACTACSADATAGASDTCGRCQSRSAATTAAARRGRVLVPMAAAVIHSP